MELKDCNISAGNDSSYGDLTAMGNVAPPFLRHNWELTQVFAARYQSNWPEGS